MKFSVEHFGLAAQDTVKLKDWYVATLDGNVRFTTQENPPAFFVELGGNLIVEIYPSASAVDETRNNRLAGWRHLALRVESLEAARDELARRGVKFTEPVKPAGGSGRILFFNDAEGNLLHLVERPAAFKELA